MSATNGVTNISQFTVEMQRIAKKLPAETALIAQRKLALTALRKLIYRTPVGNPDLWKANAGKVRGQKGYVGKDYLGGHARNNWQAELGALSGNAIAGVDANGRTTQDRGEAVIAEMKPFGVAYIANSVPYMEPLLNGHSTQAPNDFLELTFQELNASLQPAEAAP